MSTEPHIQHLDNLCQFGDETVIQLVTEIQNSLSYDDKFNILLAPSALPTLKKLMTNENSDIQSETIYLLAALSANNNTNLLEIIEWDIIKKFFAIDRIGAAALLGNLALFDKQGELIWKNGGIEQLVNCFPSLTEEDNFDEEQRLYAETLKVEAIVALGNIALVGGAKDVYEKMGHDLLLRLLKEENNPALVSEILSLIQNLTFSNDDELKRKLIQNELFIALIKFSSEFATKSNDPENVAILNDYHNNYTVPQRAACFAIANLIPYYENSGTGVDAISEQLAIFDWMMELTHSILNEGHDEEDNYTHFVMLPVAMAFNNLVHNKILRSKILEGSQENQTNNHIESIRRTLTNLIQKYQRKNSPVDSPEHDPETEIIREASEALAALGTESSKLLTEKETATSSRNEGVNRETPTVSNRLGKSASKNSKSRQTSVVIARRESTQAAKHKRDTSRTRESILKSNQETKHKKKANETKGTKKTKSARNIRVENVKTSTETNNQPKKVVSSKSLPTTSTTTEKTEIANSTAQNDTKKVTMEHKTTVVEARMGDQETKNLPKHSISSSTTETKSMAPTGEKETNTAPKIDTTAATTPAKDTSGSSALTVIDTKTTATTTTATERVDTTTSGNVASKTESSSQKSSNDYKMSPRVVASSTSPRVPPVRETSPMKSRSTEPKTSSNEPHDKPKTSALPSAETTLSSQENPVSASTTTSTNSGTTPTTTRAAGSMPSGPHSLTRTTQPTAGTITTPISSATNISANSKIPRSVNKPNPPSATTKGVIATGAPKKSESSSQAKTISK
jgi:hypothetical protein